MTNQVPKIMSRIRFVVFLEIWDGESHIEVPNIFNGHHLVKLLWGEKSNRGIALLDRCVSEGEKTLKLMAEIPTVINIICKV